MTTTVRRRTNPVPDLLNWFESGSAGEMPGIDPDKDLEVSLDGDVLTISGEHTDGILEMRVPFDGSDAESRRIHVQRQKA